MFLDKNKSKMAILQVRRYTVINATGVKEVVYDKKTKKRLRGESVGIYPGRPDIEKTWRHYKQYLDVNGMDPDVEYFTEEQYKTCWKPNSICDIDVEHLWIDNFKDYLVYEQKNSKRK